MPPAITRSNGSRPISSTLVVPGSSKPSAARWTLTEPSPAPASRGVPVTSYDITGDRDAGTTIELPSEPSAEASLRAVREKAGNLLIVSMAGMVAETLRFGDSKGRYRAGVMHSK